jgi:DnaJ-class molecular chaperone
MIVNACFLCQGVGTKGEVKTLEIQLPHGIDNGQFVRLQGMGDYRNGVFGDLIVRLNVEPQDGFDKVENHLIYNAFLNMDDLKNGSLLVPHPDGELTLKLPKVVDTSRPLRVKSKGFKLDTVGDLMVNQYVKFERD